MYRPDQKPQTCASYTEHTKPKQKHTGESDSSREVQTKPQPGTRGGQSDKFWAIVKQNTLIVTERALQGVPFHIHRNSLWRLALSLEEASAVEPKEVIGS